MSGCGYAETSVALPVIAAGVVAVALPVLAFQGAVALADQLQSDYQAAREAFEARKAAEDLRQHQVSVRQAEALAAASSLASHTAFTPGPDPTWDFLAARAHRLVLKAGEGPQAERCRHLLARVLARQGAADELLDRCLEAAADLPAPTAGPRPGPSVAVLLQVRALAEELDEQLANLGPAPELLEQLQRLQALPEAEHRMALQGLHLLGQRVRRELARRSEAHQRREARARLLRERVGEVLACAQAVFRQETLPQQVAAARQILARVAPALDAEDAPQRLEALSREAQLLFERCGGILRERVEREYLTLQIGEALLSMGYQVATPEEGGLVALLGRGTGLAFRPSEGGRLETEMVATAPPAGEVLPEAQESVCCLLDEVFDALRARDVRVKERFRKTLPAGQTLRLVALRSSQAAPPRQAQALRSLEVGP